MIPEPWLFYPVEDVCRLWYSEAREHGDVKAIAQQLGLDASQVYHVWSGRKHLPRQVVERLGLLPVSAARGNQLIGYGARRLIDLASQWRDRDG